MAAHSVRLLGGTRFDCDGQSSVLDGMMRRGRTGITVGCRGGGCGVCKVRVVEGRYRTGLMSAACVSPEERERGIALACKLFPESDLQLEVIGKINRLLARGIFDFGYGGAGPPAQARSITTP